MADTVLAVEMFMEDEQYHEYAGLMDSNADLLLGLCVSESKERRAHGTVPKVREFVEKIVPNYTAEDFKGDFRIDRETFDKLTEELRDSLTVLRQCGKPPITPEKQILIFIWYMANQDSMREMEKLFGVAKSSVHKCVWKVSETIVNILGRNIIRWPSVDEQAEVANRIEERSKIPNCIGFIDGTHIRLSCMPGGDTGYLNRKKFPSLQLQLIVDDLLVIRDTYVGWPGSTHDARVFRNSPVSRSMVIGEDNFLIGESIHKFKIQKIL